jgi:hypothetical protein
LPTLLRYITDIRLLWVCSQYYVALFVLLKRVNEGEQASLTITGPQNEFYQVFEIFYAPNGTSTTSSGQGNVPLNLTNGNDLQPHTIWTCTTRDDWGEGHRHDTKEVHSPDSTGDGWGYQVVLKLFYPSAYYGYVYGENGTGVGDVCITTPYTSMSPLLHYSPECVSYIY